MQKTKTIKTFQRKTKSGKMSTVKEHSAKYDSSEDMAKEAMKKRAGAGSELEKKTVDKKSAKDIQALTEHFHDMASDWSDGAKGGVKKLKGPDHTVAVSRVAAELHAKHGMGAKSVSESEVKALYRKHSADVSNLKTKKSSDKKELSKKEFEGAKFPKGTKPAKETKTGSVVVNAKGYKTPTAKTSTPAHGVSADEYKAWYHWDQKADPKNKVALSAEKKMKAHMGAKAYKEHFNKESEHYTSRGHKEAYNAFSAPTSNPVKAKVSTQKSYKEMKEGVSPQKQKFTPNRRPTKEEEARAEKKVNALVAKDKDVIGASDIRKQMGIPPTKAAKKEVNNLRQAKKTGLAKLEAYKPVGNAGGDSKFFSSVDKFIKGESTIDQKYSALKLIDKAMGVKSKKENARTAIHQYLTENGMSHEKAKQLSGYRGNPLKSK